MGRMKIFLTNLGKYNEGCLMGEWVKLPVPEDKLEAVLHRIGINESYEEYFITDYESLFPNLHISEYASIAELNELAEQIDGLADHDYDKLAAILECESSMSVAEILEVIEALDDFDLLADITTEEELGDYYLEDIFRGIPDTVLRYMNTEQLGRDIHLENGNGTFTSYGYLCDNR